jgi:hypothetical protein
MLVAAALVLIATGTASARLIRNWSHDELFDKSDLVVIGTVTAAKDSDERIELPGLEAQRVIGVETTFAVLSVIKGDAKLKEFTLHHYRADGGIVPNGPTFVAFSPDKRTFIAYLVREADGRYAPTVGQLDPGWHGIYELTRP